MRTKTETTEWYFFKAGSHAGMKAGPLTWERLCAQAEEGTLEPEDVVWDPGSGWRKADQVPGLFSAETTSETGGDQPAAESAEPPVRSRGRSLLLWLVPLGALIVVGVALGVYFGVFRDNGGAVMANQTTTTVNAATTTTRVTTTQSTATTRSTVAAVAGSLVTLGQSDNGHEVRLHVGDRVRIVLEPKVSKVASIDWDFIPVVVQYVDSGPSEAAGDAVADSWLELEARVSGPVTIRAQYEYVSGFVNTPWVCYLIVLK